MGLRSSSSSYNMDVIESPLLMGCWFLGVTICYYERRYCFFTERFVPNVLWRKYYALSLGMLSFRGSYFIIHAFLSTYMRSRCAPCTYFSHAWQSFLASRFDINPLIWREISVRVLQHVTAVVWIQDARPLYANKEIKLCKDLYWRYVDRK